MIVKEWRILLEKNGKADFAPFILGIPVGIVFVDGGVQEVRLVPRRTEGYWVE